MGDRVNVLTREIPLTRGYVALVDADDYEWLVQRRWYVKIDGRMAYAATGRKCVRMHKMLLPHAPMVDHINGDGLDNRRNNLRACTKSQNTANERLYRTSRSGAKGVSWNGGKWQARIRCNGVLRNLGGFASVDLAAHEYNKAAVKYFGDFARLNPVGTDPHGTGWRVTETEDKSDE